MESQQALLVLTVRVYFEDVFIVAVEEALQELALEADGLGFFELQCFAQSEAVGLKVHEALIDVL